MKLDSEIKLFIEDHLCDDINTLALQSARYPEIDIQLAIQQIRGRQIAKTKIPSWYQNEDIIYPKHLSLEQCSSEYTARYKTSLCDMGNSMVDLTGGLGVDCAFLSDKFEKTTYVEQQLDLAEIVKYNYQILNLLNIEVKQGDSTGYLDKMEPVDLIYIDPARRSSNGSKTVFIEDCTPNIIDIESLLEAKSKRTMIKLSPMLDISLALTSLRNISDVHIISHNNECKELLFVKNNESTVQSTLLHCANIRNNKTDIFVFEKEDESNTSIHCTNKIGKYLYEPNSSVIKAGAYKSIAKKFDLDKLHPSSHLYTSDILHKDFHGRSFVILDICSLNKKDIKIHLQNIKLANISTRNFPMNPQELKKRLNLKDGGDVYIFGTTLADEKKVLIICHKA